MAQMSIDLEYINGLLEEAKGMTGEEIDKILDKAERFEGLNHKEVAGLLQTEDEKHIDRIYQIAGKIKKEIYGNRIVMFAPLYVSDYCVNRCRYCGYNCTNKFERKRLSMDDVRKEVKVLEKMGHKRLALEAGEDPKNCDIDYIVDCIKTIYDMKFKNGEIRRVNVNIASTTVENYKKLSEVGIGTYILFQETYHKPSYLEQHLGGPKRNFEYHLTAFDRAMEAGIEDVGGGVLFGLADYKFEVLGLMMHNEHLEKEYKVGFHTVSVPRLRPAFGNDLSDYPHLVDDKDFKKLVAIIRLAIPYTGMIISTRETKEMREELLKIGISQISAGSNVEVGGYHASENAGAQFDVADERTPIEVLSWLIDQGLVPSFCTACYRKGRIGEAFMKITKEGHIKNLCHPNAMTTLYEYALDYGDEAFQEKVREVLKREINNIEEDMIRDITAKNLKLLEEGKRDLYL